MEIIFNIDVTNKYEKRLVKRFCDYLVYNIQHDILSKTNWLKVNIVMNSILNCDWVVWKKKPKKLNSYKIMKYIVNNIVCYKCRNNMYSIKVKYGVKFPNTQNQLDQIVRYIDKGDVFKRVQSTICISNVFNMYTQKRIDEMWHEYVVYCRNVFGDDDE